MAPVGTVVPGRRGATPTVGHGTAVSSSPREPRSDVEWHSVLQTKSRDEKWDPRDRLSQLMVEESGGPTQSSGGRGSGGPAETLLFVSSPSSSI